MEKKRERGENSEGKKSKKNQPEIRLFTTTIQMSLDSPLTWTLIAVQKKGERERERGRGRGRGRRREISF